MIQLPDEAIDEFQKIWKKTYGVELPRDEAIIRAHQVFAFVKLVFDGPLPPESWNPDRQA